MSVIIAESVGKSYAAEPVLADVSFRIGPADRIALVGPNGEGKTTLLRLIVGEEEPTSGTLWRKEDLRVGYLRQDPPAGRDTTLWQAMLDEVADLVRMEGELSALADELARNDGDRKLLKRYGALQTRFEARGGYAYPHRIRTVLSGLGFDAGRYDQPLAQLSGGERTRAALAGLLLRDAELLLLDEPTNHLDLQATEWLERFLQDFRGALAVVSHDRYFMDKVARNTWEVRGGAVESYRGPYSAYIRQRAERLKQRRRLWQAQQEHVAKEEDFIRRNLSGQRSREARGRRTRLERFLAAEAIDRPRDARQIRIRMTPARRSGDLVLRATELAVGYDAAPLLRAKRLQVRRGQRVAIVGANGTGKTTLLKVLLARLQPLSGTVEHGAGVAAGYLSQTHEDLPAGATALEAVMSAGEDVRPQRARTLLGGFLLTGDEVLKRIGELSGGQRSRVVLARLTVQRPNLLVLDEPTNHLDLPSREVLQSVLADFEGTVVFVSHDRYLIQSLATHVWGLEAGEVHCVRGDWEAYVQWRSRQADRAAEAGAGGGKPGRAAAPGASKATRRRDNRRRKQHRRLQRRHERLEQQIHELEARLAALTEQITTAGEAGDTDEVLRLGREYEQDDARLRALWEEWTQIGEEIEP